MRPTNQEIESDRKVATDGIDISTRRFVSSQGSGLLNQLSMAATNRRPMIVLSALVGAMTLSSGLLLMLEPGPMLRPPHPINLRAPSLPGPKAPMLFDTTAPPQPDWWRAIVVSESGRVGDTAESIAARHREQGEEGLNCHFVVEPGTSASSTAVHSGFRWRTQRSGAWATGPYRDWYNRHAISICLVGNSDEKAPDETQLRRMIELIHSLQKRFDIPASQVRHASETDEKISLGRYFPAGYLRQSLLTTTD